MAVALGRSYVQEWAAPKTELIVKIRNSIFGAGLWVAAAGASALSLGASRGAVVLGAPVDLSFDVQPDPGTDVASSCVTAQLVAGDMPIGSAKVRVVPLPDLRGRSPAVRVQAAVVMDEPMLTVTLSAGCAGKVTRTYTFLTELPATAARSASPVDVARLPLAGVPGAAVGAAAPAAGARTEAQSGPESRNAPAAGERAAASAPRAVPPPATALAAARKRGAAPPATATAQPPAKNSPAPAKPAADRARLVVEPLDVWLDRPVALRASPELLVTPSEQASAQRAQAAATWKALNASSDGVSPDGDRLKALEADVAQVRAQAARDRANAARLQQQLEQAENERFPATVVYALGGLLLLALLLVAWSWTRMRTASEKAVRAWRDSVAAMGGNAVMVEHAAALGLAPHPNDDWLPSDALAEAGGPATDPAAAPVQPAFVVTAPVPSAPAPLKTASRTPVGVPPPVHIASPEELFDVQQQAEFFVSVGEHQQAIEVLKSHIAERGDTSPLAYLELLRLYHSLSRVEEFSQLRTQFMQSFNAQVPDFANFHRTGRMLYHYPDALAEIEAEWTSPSVLQLLEKLLFRQGGAGSVEPFDLAAYDDLLLLLAIAQTTPASARGAPAPRKRTTPLPPLRDESRMVEAPAASAVAGKPAAPALAAGLDFDFDELPPAPPAPAPWAHGEDSRGMPLDLDLSDPPHLTLSDLPPVPVTAPPSPGQVVGFGSDNDLMELRLELEQKKADRR